jgi:hypothetical protein
MAVPQMDQAVRRRFPTSNATAPSQSCAVSEEAPSDRRASRKRFAARVPWSAGMKSDRKSGMEASERTSRMPPRVRKPVKTPRNPQSRARNRSRSSCQAEGWSDGLAALTGEKGSSSGVGGSFCALENARAGAHRRSRRRNVGARALRPRRSQIYVVAVPPAHSPRGKRFGPPGEALSIRGTVSCF